MICGKIFKLGPRGTQQPGTVTADACGPLFNQGAQVSITPGCNHQLSLPRPLLPGKALPPHFCDWRCSRAGRCRGETGFFRGACGCDLHEQIMRGPVACVGSLTLPSPAAWPFPSVLGQCLAVAGCPGVSHVAASWGRDLLCRQAQGLRCARAGVGALMRPRAPPFCHGRTRPPPRTWRAPVPPAGTFFLSAVRPGRRPAPSSLAPATSPAQSDHSPLTPSQPTVPRCPHVWGNRRPVPAARAPRLRAGCPGY